MREVQLTGGVSLHISEGPARPPALFLHGFLGSSDEWRFLDHALQHRMTGRIDLPGHGHSASADGRAYSFKASLEWMDAAVAALGGVPVDLVGYSMGGRLALLYALERPQHVSSVLLESTSPGIDHDDDRRARRALDQTRSEQLQRVGLASFMRDWYRQPLFDSIARRERLLKNVIERRRGGDAAAVARALEAFSPGRQPSLWPRLTEIACPMTFVAGSLDERYVGIGREVVAKASTARLEIVPEAGHNVHLEQPERYLALLMNHFNESI